MSKRKPEEHHGMSKTNLYRRWVDMRERCSNTSEYKPYRHLYAEAGITVCDEWKSSFVKFKEWATENGYSKELQLDRINGDEGYSPDNCRWVTPRENSVNTKPQRNRSSKFKGVYWNKINNNWRSEIYSRGKRYSVGSFKSEKEAALAYNKMAEKLHGSMAYLNIIEEDI